jgi:hypothetical protein
MYLSCMDGWLTAFAGIKIDLLLQKERGLELEQKTVSHGNPEMPVAWTLFDGRLTALIKKGAVQGNVSYVSFSSLSAIFASPPSPRPPSSPELRCV